MYYRVDTREVLTVHSEIRASFIRNGPVVMFSDIITDEDLAHRGVFPLVANPPAVTATQVAVPADVNQIDGVWTQEYTVRDKTQAELDADKPKVPTSVTRRQARQALALQGVLSSVEPMLAKLDDGTPAGAAKRQLATIEWEDSLEFDRNRPLVIELGTALGLDAAKLDALFIFAATL